MGLKLANESERKGGGWRRECVCVCERERERERGRKSGSTGMVIANNKIYFVGLLNPAAE